MTGIRTPPGFPGAGTDGARAIVFLNGIGRTALVASSWGTTIAIALAARQSERISHLVLSGPTAGYGSLPQAQQGVTLDGYLQALHALVHADAAREIETVTCPVLVVYGQVDAIAPPPQHALRLAAALPSARLHGLARCGHLPHAERPESFNRLVEAFLDP